MKGRRLRGDRAALDVIDGHGRFCEREHLSRRDAFRRGGFPRDGGGVVAHVSAGSGRTIPIRFCATCCTRLWMTFERFPGKDGVGSGISAPDWFGPAPDRLYVCLSETPLGRLLAAGADVCDAHCFAAKGVPDTPRRFAAVTPVTAALRVESRAPPAAQGRR